MICGLGSRPSLQGILTSAMTTSILRVRSILTKVVQQRSSEGRALRSLSTATLTKYEAVTRPGHWPRCSPTLSAHSYCHVVGETIDRNVADGILQYPGALQNVPDDNFALFMLQEMAAVPADAQAIVDAASGEARTYGELRRLVPRVAGGLRAAGVRPRHTVMLVVHSHLDFPLVFLAVLYLGAIPALVNSEITPKNLVHKAELSEARWAVVQESAAAVAEATFSALPQNPIKATWVLGGASLHSLAEHQPVPPYTTSDGLDTRHSPGILMFSSGTTGLPKSVMLSHRNLSASVLWKSKLISDGYTPDLRELHARVATITPMTHAYAFNQVMHTLMLGGTVIFDTKFKLEKLLRTVEKHKVTTIILVPHIVDLLTQSQLVQQANLSSLKAVFSAGSALSASTAFSLAEKLEVLVSNMYGMTEVASVLLEGKITKHSREINESEGDGIPLKPVPSFQIKVVDPASGLVVGLGEMGELYLRGPCCMLGYMNNPSATADAIDPEGWLHTGDLAIYGDGCVYIKKDRLKDLIKVKSYQVAPMELEKVLLSHPQVQEAAVVGVEHPKTGEAPRAFVVPRPGADPTPELLQQFVAERVVEHQRLRGGVVLVDALPRSLMGKLLKKQLK